MSVKTGVYVLYDEEGNGYETTEQEGAYVAPEDTSGTVIRTTVDDDYDYGAVKVSHSNRRLDSIADN